MKQHPEHPEIWITPDGRVFRELIPSFDGNGYGVIRNGKFRVRRGVLVCGAYHGPRPDGLVLRHLDGNASNDAPGNLIWGTQAENCADTVAHGKSTAGAKNAQAKLTESQAKEILTRKAAGEASRTLAKEFGISEASVCCLFKGRTWKHLHKH